MAIVSELKQLVPCNLTTGSTRVVCLTSTTSFDGVEYLRVLPPFQWLVAPQAESGNCTENICQHPATG
eukprot:COSAG02_NODE_39_length_48074_cov_106.508890_16_plen_68_part_00